MSENLDKLRAILDDMRADDPAIIKIPYVVDHMSTPLVYANHEGVIIWVNRAARELFGYTFKEMVGKGLELLIPLHLREHHEKAFARRVQEEFTQVGGEPVKDVVLKSQAINKSGEEFPVDIFLSSYKHNGDLTFNASIRRT